MLGESLLVTPVVQAGAASVEAWLPPRTRAFRVPDWAPVDASPSSTTTLDSPLGDPAPLLLLPGGVVAVGADVGANTTAAARAAPLAIAAAVPGDGAPVPLRCGRACADAAAACGDLYLDSGEDAAPGAKRGRVLAVDADARKIRLTWPGDGPCERVDWPKLESVVVLSGGGGGDSKPRARACAVAAAPTARPRSASRAGWWPRLTGEALPSSVRTRWRWSLSSVCERKRKKSISYPPPFLKHAPLLSQPPHQRRLLPPPKPGAFQVGGHAAVRGPHVVESRQNGPRRRGRENRRV